MKDVSSKAKICQDFVCTDSNFAMNQWILKPPGTYLNTDKTKCCEEESNLYLKRRVQTKRSKFKIGQDYVCPDSIFAMDGWMLKSLGTNLNMTQL